MAQKLFHTHRSCLLGEHIIKLNIKSVLSFQPPLTGEGHKAAKQHVRQQKLAGISRVVGVSKLRTKFEAPEAKRQLCNSYDIFLADERVIPSLPKLLGKHLDLTIAVQTIGLHEADLPKNPRRQNSRSIHTLPREELVVCLKAEGLQS